MDAVDHNGRDRLGGDNLTMRADLLILVLRFILPLRLIQKGQINETLIAILKANSRKPDSVID